MIHDVFAYLHVDGAARAIEFYATVFGATEKLRLTDLDGRIQHAELDFGGTTSCWPTSSPSTACAAR